LLSLNDNQGFHITVIAMGRNKDKFEKLYGSLSKRDDLVFLEQDVKTPISYDGKVDYVFHLASNTNPVLYASRPIDTEMTNVLGTYNVLEFASSHSAKGVFFSSSGDVYGSETDPTKMFYETDLGQVNFNSLRAVYTEGKRAAESLCQAFISEKALPVVIGRLCRIYGPTVNSDDSRGISEFLFNAVKGNPIVIKSEGKQIYSYLYVVDLISAILFVTLNGKTGEAYNISDIGQMVSLRDLASDIGKLGGVPVTFGENTGLQAKGAGNFANSRLNNDKLLSLGWKPLFDFKTGLQKTFQALKDLSR
jgi:UDP-glucuronate decarboxylase